MYNLNPQYWFEDVSVLAELPAAKIAEKLREMEDSETAEWFDGLDEQIYAAAGGEKLLWKDKPWQHTEVAFGYIPPKPNAKDVVEIKHAGNMRADDSLKNARIKVTLDRLRVADYPGKGMHHILFDFYAQNQLKDHVEDLHFNQTYQAQEGEQASIIGYPVFIGLNVGLEGVIFKCMTVNVKNDNDEAILNFLDQDIFQAGLKLATTVQPAIAPLTSMAIGLTKMIAKRNKNVPVQKFYMGLDFSNVATRARLAPGSYIAVQIPNCDWDWREWVYNPTNGRIVKQDDLSALIPYNYIVFGVSKYEESE
ncbi:hypothetical protein C5S29_02800 [ANME-1 cluster archaeon GoMg3.2]|nr:hypothetical protein [ANME-1 cluster archaeon GoMg3.2]